MAMSRSLGGTSLTTRSPMRSVPFEICSSPATMRNAVVLPQPDGPTSTMNSPSFTVRSRDRTASVPSPYTFQTSSRTISATDSRLPGCGGGGALDEVEVEVVPGGRGAAASEHLEQQPGSEVAAIE